MKTREEVLQLLQSMQQNMGSLNTRLDNLWYKVNRLLGDEQLCNEIEHCMWEGEKNALTLQIEQLANIIMPIYDAISAESMRDYEKMKRMKDALKSIHSISSTF